jgi:hypothetical protein
MAEPVVIDGLIHFMAQRQGSVVVVQCMECGEHISVVGPRESRRWQEGHKLTCPGDDGE